MYQCTVLDRPVGSGWWGVRRGRRAPPDQLTISQQGHFSEQGCHKFVCLFKGRIASWPDELNLYLQSSLGLKRHKAIEMVFAHVGQDGGGD